MESFVAVLKQFCGFLVVVVIMFGCGSSKKGMTPAQIISAAKDQPELLDKSMITINYSIYNKGIRDTFHYFIDSLYGMDWLLDEYDATVTLQRTSDVSVEFSGRNILMSLPTKFQVVKKTFLGDITANGEVKLQFLSTFEIDTLWKFTTKTALTKYEWIQKPKLNMGITSLPVEAISNQIFDRVKPMIEESIDEGIRFNFDLRSSMLEITRNIATPYKMEGMYDGWIYMIPDTAFMTGAKSKRDVTTGIVAIQTKTVISSERPAASLFPKLPKLVWKENVKDSSTIALKMDFTYNFLDSIARGEVVGKTFNDGGRSIKVNNIKIGPLGQRLSITVSVSGSFNGNIVLLGIPYYDSFNKMLKVKDIDFELRTSNILHKAAAWIMKGKIKNELGKAMEFPLKDKLKDAQDEIDRQVYNFYNPYNMSVIAKMGDIEISDVQPKAEKVISTIKMKMYISTFFKDMSFFRD
jgi:hypothetical protein